MSCEEDLWSPKDPDEVTDYAVTWANALGNLDTIVDSDVSVVNPDECGVVIDSEAMDAPVHTVWLSGGTLNTIAKIRFKIVTADGRTEYKTQDLAIRTR